MIDSGYLVPVGRQKIPPRALVGGDLSEDVDEPCADVDTDGFAGGDKGVCDGGPDCGGVIAGEEIVFPAQGQRTDSILDAVVVDLIPSVQDIAAEPWQVNCPLKVGRVIDLF